MEDSELKEKYMQIEDLDGWWKSICPEHPQKDCCTCEQRGPEHELDNSRDNWVTITCKLALEALEEGNIRVPKTFLVTIDCTRDMDSERLKDMIEEAYMLYFQDDDDYKTAKVTVRGA